jgi:hypothetical protein
VLCSLLLWLVFLATARGKPNEKEERDMSFFFLFSFFLQGAAILRYNQCTVWGTRNMGKTGPNYRTQISKQTKRKFGVKRNN